MNLENITTALIYIIGGFIVFLTIVWIFIGYQLYKLIKLIRGGLMIASSEIKFVSKIFHFVKNQFTSHDDDTHRRI